MCILTQRVRRARGCQVGGPETRSSPQYERPSREADQQSYPECGKPYGHYRGKTEYSGREQQQKSRIEDGESGHERAQAGKEQGK